MKKILCLILAVAVCFSLLAVSISAASTYDIQIGEKLHFDRFINVREYAENAGKKNYDKFELLYISGHQSYFDGEATTFNLFMYLYNPNRINFGEKHLYCLSAFVTEPFLDSNFSSAGVLIGSDDENSSFNDLFIVACFSFYVFREFTEEEIANTKLHVQELYVSDSSFDAPDSESSRTYLDVNVDVGIADVNLVKSKKTVTGDSSPLNLLFATSFLFVGVAASAIVIGKISKRKNSQRRY